MSSAMPSAPYPPYYHDDEPRRWLSAGLTALFVLIGLAIVIAVMAPMMRGAMPMWAINWSPGDWLLQLLVLGVVIWIAVWIFRLIFWSATGMPYGPHRYYSHRAYRDYYRPWPMGLDPAVAVARERFARGEITREQLDQIVRDLGHATV